MEVVAYPLQQTAEEEVEVVEVVLHLAEEVRMAAGEAEVVGEQRFAAAAAQLDIHNLE